jgi:hypothetical protein
MRQMAISSRKKFVGKTTAAKRSGPHAVGQRATARADAVVPLSYNWAPEKGGLDAAAGVGRGLPEDIRRGKCARGKRVEKGNLIPAQR